MRLSDGSDTRIVAVLRDITQQREATEDLRVSLETLRETDLQRRRLLGQLVSAQEEERARIAEDIHDDSVQAMSAVGLRLELVRRRVDDPDVLERIDILASSIRNAVARLRRLLFELRPRALDTGGLTLALEEYLEETMPEAGLDYRLLGTLSTEPDPEIRVILYRMALEALVNVRKHASATRVEITLREMDGGVFLRIDDNGVGMDETAPAERRGHLGFAAMRERATGAGGWWRVRNRTRGGTRVECWLPSGRRYDELSEMEAVVGNHHRRADQVTPPQSA
jgi:signal transduction histidine kinase